MAIEPTPRVSCDSLVALGSATADGSVLFAKNSDRPARECQPLALIPAATHPPGSRLRCQYIEIPQVERTLRVVGSRPFWLWGLEHGVNQAGVAIGNHTVFTRDKPEGHKLIGMDLVRLGLERGASARQAIDVICGLVEQYGQGGSGYHDSDFPYHSSFLVADPREAWLLETSDREWALRRIEAVGNATNHVTIESDWEELSPGAVQRAEAGGWPQGSGERFDFAAAYRDTSWVPPSFSSGRCRRAAELLEAERGAITEEVLRSALRDHYGVADFGSVTDASDERYMSICMHADPIGTTTAAAVIRLADDARPIRVWACFGPPCIGVFIPVYPEAELSPAVLEGKADADSGGLWWAFRDLLDLVERDPGRYAPVVRSFWTAEERRFIDAADALEAGLAADDPARATQLSVLSRACAERAAAGVAQIAAELRDR